MAEVITGSDLLHADWSIRPVDYLRVKRFIYHHHYARIMPSTTVVSYGLYIGDELMGVSAWGYGVRPQHTIRKWFPGLGVGDYLELNRLCLLDVMPRNSESRFISLVVGRLKRDFPRLQVLLSWADGLRGKPGYVYQACSWLYGGYIRSEFYTTDKGEVLHPRLLITRFGSRGKAVQSALGLNHYFGKQFMYCKFLCSRVRRKQLLAASPFVWGTAYPKGGDIVWSLSKAGGARELIDYAPELRGRDYNIALGGVDIDRQLLLFAG